MPKSIAELTMFMDQLTKALDAIVEGVALNAIDEVAELLSQFNQLVPECDDRLQFCTGLLARGLREEALGYEADDPPLLATATLLDLSARPQWDSWLAAMRLLGFPEPVMPNHRAAAEIRAAQDQVLALRPLLDRMRRGNLANAPLTARINTLRLLRAKDPNNEAWFEGIRSHERQRLMEIDAAVKIAVARSNEPMLEALLAELRGEWIEPPPDRVIAAAAEAHRRLKDLRIGGELEETLASLLAARDARDLDAARQIRERWDRLVADKAAFAVDDERLARAAPPLEWLASHDRLESLASEVWNALDGRPDTRRGRREWVRQLTRMRDEVEDLAERLRDELEIEPIERLRTRVSRVEEDHQREQSARRTLAYLIVAAAALAIVGIVAIGVSIVRHNDQVATAIAELAALGERVRAGEFDPDKVPMPPLAEPLLQDPAVAARMRDLDAAVASERERLDRLRDGQTRLTGMLDALAAVEHLSDLQAWPEPFVAATALLSEMAEASLAKSAEEQASLEKQGGLLQNAARRFMRDGDDVIQSRIAALRKRLATLDERAAATRADGGDAMDLLAETADAVEDDADALRLLATAQAAPGAVGRFAAVRKVSDGAIGPVKPDGEIYGALAAIRQKIDEQRRRTVAERRLGDSLGDWNRYADALKEAAGAFPQSAIARDYQEAAEDLPLWLAIEQWNTFASTIRSYATLSPDQAAAEFATLEGLAHAAKKLPFVGRFLEQTEPYVRSFRDRKPDEVRKELLDWVNREWLGEIEWVVRTDAADGTPMTYFCVIEPQKPANPGDPLKFKYQRLIKVGGNWPKPVAGPDLPRFKIERSPQRILAEALENNCLLALGRGNDGFSLEEALVDAVSQTLAAKEVEPSLRLLTLRKLILTGQELSPLFQSDDIEELSKGLDDGNGGIPDIAIEVLGEFLDPERRVNAAYQRVKKAADRLLSDAGPISARLAESAKATRERLSNQRVPTLVCVGRLGRDARGQATLVTKPPGKIPSDHGLFVVEPNGETTRIGECDQNGRPHLEGRARVTGTPAFVWVRKGEE